MEESEKQKNYELAEKLYAEQNFTAALIAGIVAIVPAAMAYGIVARTIPQAIGIGAAIAGIIVGLAVGFVGRGLTNKFGVVAAVCTIASCLMGNFVAHLIAAAKANHTTLPETIGSYSLAELAEWSIAGLTPLYLLYLFIAVFAAVFLAKRGLSRADKLALGMYELKK